LLVPRGAVNPAQSTASSPLYVGAGHRTQCGENNPENQLILQHVETRNHQELQALPWTSLKQQGSTMPKDMHQKAAEHHEQTAKAHRTVAQQHGSNDHAAAKQQSAQAVEKSKAAHEHSTQANNKSQQQK
jgi:hypothetical protein